MSAPTARRALRRLAAALAFGLPAASPLAAQSSALEVAAAEPPAERVSPGSGEAPGTGGAVAAAFALDPRLAASLAPASDPPPRRFLLDVTGFCESVELGEVTEDVIAANFSTNTSIKIGEVDIDDVDRKRAGVKGRFGMEEFAGEFSVFGEKFEPFDTFRLVGFRMAAVGTPRVDSWGDVSLIFDYAVGISMEFGSGNVEFVDTTTGSTFNQDGNIAYVGEDVHLGVGVDVAGFQLLVGGMSDSLGGSIDVDVDENIDFNASNLGGYASVGYRAAEAPIYGRVTAYFGDYRGVAVELGVRF